MIVRRARAEEAATIFAIKRAAFAASSLPFSIYQSPKAITYIQGLIRDVQYHHYFVADEGAAVVGYYHALVAEGGLFLNYIATDEAARGSGVGRALYAHFEGRAIALGLPKAVLDVSEGNGGARAWYLRKGYRETRRTRLARIALESGSAASNVRSLSCDSEALACALAQEQERGFSRISCRLGDRSVEVGLIGGDTCKLLGGNAPTEDAVAAVAQTFSSMRRVLIVEDTGLESKWQVLTRETTLRLEKTLVSSP